MHRRGFLRGSAGVFAGFLSPELLRAAIPTRWRTFEITTRIEILKPSGATRIWAPEVLIVDTNFQKGGKTGVQCDGGVVRVHRHKAEGLGIIAAEFPAGVRPLLTVRSRAAARNWHSDVSVASAPPVLSSAERKQFLSSTRMIPIDGIVKEKGIEITRRARSDLDKARAIYEWIVENTYRNPKTRGCGVGDVRFMLESRDLGGKCADLNALYVGLARASGLPARDVYGIRVAPSQMGYKSLGTSSANITKAQHCRAEVYLTEYGWIPVDPADVRKVVLEEPPGNRPLDDELVEKARTRLFGSWEMNWLAYNFAQDVALPSASGPPVHFFMYPQAETADGRLDCLDPAGFRYEITAREIAA